MKRGNDKGTGIVCVQGLLKRPGSAIEQQFPSQLTAEERDYFRPTAEFRWIPLEVIPRFFELAAPLLDPADTSGLPRIGREMARGPLGAGPCCIEPRRE